MTFAPTTQCVVPPKVDAREFVSLAVPTYRGSTVVFPSAKAFEDRVRRTAEGYTYGLHGTPTTRTLEAQITLLQGGLGTSLVPSGLAAITVIMQALLRPGDHLLIPSNMYRPGLAFCHGFLAERGVAVTEYPPDVGAALGALIRPSTKLVWVESPGSNTMEVQDVPAIVAAASARGVPVGCDNSWATPLLFSPLRFGVALVAEALTKYIGGHSDLLLGAITAARAEDRDSIKSTIRAMGIGVSPDDAALALRGLQTLAVRLAHVGRTALDIASRLADVPVVEQVLHPGLASCPGHKFWQRDFAGASGVFSVVLRPEAKQRLAAALDGLRLFALGTSWGGTRSVIVPIEGTGIAPRSLGPLLRLSIGLEDIEDLWRDLEPFFGTLADGS